MYKIKNLMEDFRQFTEAKTGKIYVIEPNGEIITDYPPINYEESVFIVEKVEEPKIDN